MTPNANNIIQQFFDFFIAWDHLMFVKINGIWTNPIFDKVMPIVTDLHKSPIGLAVIAALVAFWCFRDRRHGWRFVVAIALAVTASDLGAYRLVKPLVARPRPEFTQGLPVTLRVPSSKSFSFPSNHAGNMFAAATVIACAAPSVGIWAFLFACFICYSRVYVGVHFPFDVMAGAFIGFILGRIVWNLLGHWCEYEPPPVESGRLKSYVRSGKNPTGE